MKDALRYVLTLLEVFIVPVTMVLCLMVTIQLVKVKLTLNYTDMYDNIYKIAILKKLMLFTM